MLIVISFLILVILVTIIVEFIYSLVLEIMDSFKKQNSFSQNLRLIIIEIILVMLLFILKELLIETITTINNFF
jgi:hypothetical protein